MLSLSYCLTDLFPIYQYKHWTIRRWDDHIVVSSSNRIKSKIDWILIRSWSTLQRGWNIVSNDGQLQYWATFRQCYLLYIHKQEHFSFSSPKKDYQTAYEEKILCLFTVTLWGKVGCPFFCLQLRYLIVMDKMEEKVITNYWWLQFIPSVEYFGLTDYNRSYLMKFYEIKVAKFLQIYGRLISHV